MSERYGQRLGRFVGLDQPPTLSTRLLQVAEVSATRLRWNESGSEIPVRMERNDGYLLCLQRLPLASGPYWVDGRPVPLMPIDRGQFLLLDLTQEHASLTGGSVDCVSMYTSRQALDRFHEEHDLRPAGSLRAAGGVGLQDEVIRNLGECLVPAFDRPEHANQLFFDHVALALLSHLTVVYAEQPAVMRPLRGGLAPWQERLAKEMLLASMDGKIGLDALAQACRLSRSHFARAFKATTGTSPIRWLLAQRIEQAKNLLLNSRDPIDRIATSCGFADQSHFTRVFLKAMKATPGQWRRQRGT